MNLNYVGSVAERFMKFSAALQATEVKPSSVFNAVSIYIPKSLAAANMADGSYVADDITATKYAVIAVTVDNYTDVMKAGSALLNQWTPVFNDGGNTDIILYLVIFDDTDFTPVLGVGGISWAPLTKAFNELFFISFFKTMFSEHYDGSKSTESGSEYDDSNYFDFVLALSYLCENELNLSYNLVESTVTLFESGAEDTNALKAMSITRADELSHCTTFVGSTVTTRAQYFWGYMYLIGFKHSLFNINNGAYMIPILLGKYFENKNTTKGYVGNKIAKIRLSGPRVKPTGFPSPVDGDVNINLPKSIYDILDSKHIGYFIAISDSSENDAELIDDRSGAGVPLKAYMISRKIDYDTSQEIADLSAANSTLTQPMLMNQTTYAQIQNVLIKNIQTYASIGRLSNIVLNFPSFTEAKDGQKFTGTGAWSAVFMDDFGSVNISGTISF